MPRRARGSEEPSSRPAMSALLQLLVHTCCLSLAAPAAVPAAAAPSPDTRYLFSYFVHNGEDGLHLAWSADGYTWKALQGGKSFLTPTVGESKLMRDPSLLRGPDGTFHLVWTTSWQGKTIGYASSKDLLHWSEQKAVPVMADEPSARNCWAPELFYENQNHRFLIVWSTTITGRFDNTHRSYFVTTTDFKDFTPAQLFFDPGFNVIDDTIAEFAGKYYLIFKDERTGAGHKSLRWAVGDTMEGPWKNVSRPFTREMVEGPAWLKLGDQYIVYYDCFSEEHYGAVLTKDFQNWQDVSARLAMPKGIRHGTALAVPAEVLEKMKEKDKG